MKARLASFATLPKRVFRMGPAAPALANAHQDVLVGPIRAAQLYAGAHYCDQHPLQLARVSGDVTPGGTVTATGKCFGPPAGRVQMLGTFPNEKGTVALSVLSWTDQTITAKIPAITRAPDQAVDIRLERPAATMSLHEKGTQEVFSLAARLSFLGIRELDDVSNKGFSSTCMQGDHPQTDTCSSAGGCDWIGNCMWGWHTQAAPDSGTDTWRLHLPPGWRFDHIELSGQDANTTLDIDPTIDPTNVTWSVHWKTVHWKREATHVGNHVTYNEGDEGTYWLLVFATGAAGTLK
jgi:hypothetical protein